MLIDKFVIKNFHNYIEVHIEVKVNGVDTYEFRDSTAFVEEMEKYTFHEVIEDNPVTRKVIEEIQRLKEDINYNPNDKTARQSYLRILVENLDSHWH